MARPQSIGLRAALIVPLVMVVIGGVFGLIWVQEWAARREAREQLDRRAESVVSGIVERLKDHQRAKDIYVRLVAREPDLAEAIQNADQAGIARILVPLKATLDLGFVRAYDQSSQVLLALGDSDDETYAALHADARAGLSRSLVTIGPRGLHVVAAAPVKGPQGVVGSIVIGFIYTSERLDQVKADSAVQLLVAHNGEIVSSTVRADPMAPAAQNVIQDLRNGATLDQIADRWGIRTAEYRLSENDSLITLIPTADVIAASERRSFVSMTGLLVLVGTLIVGGLILTHSLSAPLNGMMAAAAGIQAGEYHRRVRPSRVREFEIVGSAMNELSAQVEAQLSELTHRAFYDRLTDLPNRALLKDRLGQAVARATRRGGHLAVLFLDLDNFKVVNDSLGHEVGDALLVALAERLRGAVRPEDTVARLGGDEFVVLIEDVAGPDEAREIAERLHERLAPRYHIEGHDLFAVASVGIALSYPGVDDPEDLMRNADVAMYHAKSQGKGRCVVFEPRMNEHAVERLALETDLRGALERGEMRVAYQPIVQLASGRIIEVEALLRWDHPTRGPISPVQFIPIAEETGLIVPLGAWALCEAACQAHIWEVTHPGVPLVLSVNLSARQFQHRTLVADVWRVLQESGLDPRRLKLEITESAVMDDVNAAIVILEQFKALGIQLAIDDFGTGYSSLAQLRRLPVDILKIDRAFVSRLQHGTEDEAIVRSIMDLANSLRLDVTGEGIETAQQADHLRELGCNQGQGFFFAKAMTPEGIECLLVTDPPVLPPHLSELGTPDLVTPGV